MHCYHSFNTLLSTLSRFTHFTLYLETASLHILAFTFQLILFCSLYEGPFLISCLSVTTCPNGSYLKQMNYNCISYPMYIPIFISRSSTTFLLLKSLLDIVFVYVKLTIGGVGSSRKSGTLHYNSYCTVQKFRQIDHVQTLVVE